MKYPDDELRSTHIIIEKKKSSIDRMKKTGQKQTKTKEEKKSDDDNVFDQSIFDNGCSCSISNLF